MQDALPSNVIRGERARDEPVSGSSADSDADLVALAQIDRGQFAALYDRYLDRVYRYCFVRLGNREAAEDATSLIFTKAFDSINSQRGESFRGWLFTIAHNVLFDLSNARRTTDRLDHATEIADPGPAPDDLAANHDIGRAIRDALQQLTPNQRDVVELRLAGLTGPEIARALSKSHAAIRITQFRAYAHLRALLSDAWKETNDVA